MKKQISKILFFLFAVSIIAGISIYSCKKDNSGPSVNKTALEDSLTVANTLYSGATEGVALGDFQYGTKVVLDTVIAQVTRVYNNTSSTQAQINAALANLEAGMTAFRSKTIVPVDQADLIAQWTFSEGTGTTVKDSKSQLVGTLVAGSSSFYPNTGALPTWTADRYGHPNQALHFGNGSHVEVPPSALLEPTSITISLWVNADSVYCNAYMISQNWWWGYKFQLQCQAKPFMTWVSAFTPGDTSNIVYSNLDYNQQTGISINTWHHLAVTYTSGTEVFYVDGAAIYTWTANNTTATNVTGSMTYIGAEQPFLIGAGYPNAYTNAKSFGTNAPLGDGPGGWGIAPHFIGSMDEIRIYKVALSAAQISSIYALEAPAAK